MAVQKNFPRQKIADFLGVSNQRVSQIEKSAKKRIARSRIFKEMFGEVPTDEEEETKLARKRR